MIGGFPLIELDTYEKLRQEDPVRSFGNYISLQDASYKALVKDCKLANTSDEVEDDESSGLLGTDTFFIHSNTKPKTTLLT